MRMAHTAAMNKRCSWEGCALPNPPRGRGLGARASGPRPRGMGKPGCPIPLLEGCALLPPRGRGNGETRFPQYPCVRASPSRGQGRGETWFPHTPAPQQPMFTSAIHAARAAYRQDEHNSWEGFALPNPPRGRGLGARASGPRPLMAGETRFPQPPPPRGYVHIRRRRAHSFVGAGGGRAGRQAD